MVTWVLDHVGSEKTGSENWVYGSNMWALKRETVRQFEIQDATTWVVWQLQNSEKRGSENWALWQQYVGSEKRDSET